LFTGDLSWRELGVFLKHMPMESATQTAIRDSFTEDELDALADTRGDEHGSWSKTDLLLASISDAIAHLTYVQVSRAGVKAEPPEPMRRPGVRSNKVRQDPAAMAYLKARARQPLVAPE
jgi:hypothetical protein